MKKIIIFLFMLISFSIIAQNPCLDGTIIINGQSTDAVFIDNTNNTGFNLPLWLKSGSTLAAGDRVHFISLIEFDEVTVNNSTSLIYSTVIQVGTQTETVPAGKVWKVEAIVKHANAFASGFTASSNSPVCQGSTLNLSATTVTGATYSWTGPNGFTSNVQNPVINNASQAAAGTYSMTATLNGCTSTTSTTDVVVNALPVSTFTNTPSLVIVNNNNTFTPTLSGASYSWVFDQGTPATSNVENPIVQWSSAGNYGVTLTVTDNNGCASSTQQVVAVSNCTPGQPSSDFAWSPTSPQPGQTVTFDPTTTGATYDWSFTGGSITTSTDENPDVSWSNAGTYNVSLTVTDGNGCYTNTTNPVIVKVPINITFNATSTGYTGTIQSWTVPAGITSIDIEAFGAQGGSVGSYSGGKGARMKGNFNVTPGAELHIVVGQKGGDATTDNCNGGAGGGGSFIWINGQNTPLIIAGGGGGAHNANFLGTDGTTSNDGYSGSNTAGVSGTNGNGGEAGPCGSGWPGAGGGGWFSKGGNTCVWNGGIVEGGGSKATNFVGGKHNPQSSSGADGGFGGGGGSFHGAGGGGGYSGGGGGGSCDAASKPAGGGGGSYNAGTNQNNSSGANSGHGKVIITY